MSFREICRVPLFRLLAVNLAIGIASAMLMIVGLMFVNPHGLRDLIVADRSGGVTIALLAFGFVVTFGSTAMGTAIMMLGSGGSGGSKPLVADIPVPLKIPAR